MPVNAGRKDVALASRVMDSFPIGALVVLWLHPQNDESPDEDEDFDDDWCRTCDRCGSCETHDCGGCLTREELYEMGYTDEELDEHFGEGK